MSFIRQPSYRTRSVGGRPVKPDRKPRKARKKPWDDTVHDLSVYRATAEEQEHRRIVHQSQNMGAVKQDQLKKRITKARKNSSAADSRRNALMKEVLFNHSQLEDVLARSDQVMAVVKDLFGDDPKKYRGLPRITVAPDKHDPSMLPGAEKLDRPSKLDELSDSMMDKTALNDLEDSDEYEDEYEEEELSYQPVLDFNRFQKFLQEEQAKVKNEDKNGGVSQSVAAKAMEQILRMAAQSSGDQEATSGSPHVRAINDTVKVKRTMARTPQDQESNVDAQEKVEQAEQEHTQPQNQKNNTEVGQQYYIPADPSPEDVLHLQSLKTIVEDLERRISEYECITGRNPPPQRLIPHTAPGYLLAVADNVSRLFNYLKQSELRLRAETTLREQLGQDVFFLKNLVDTLTEDIICGQEEHAKLKMSFARFQHQHMQDIASLREELISRGVFVEQSSKPPRAASAPLDNESVTMEELASHMQTTLRMANNLNRENMANGTAHAMHQNYHAVADNSRNTSNGHSAQILSSQGLTNGTIHVSQPLHPAGPQKYNPVQSRTADQNSLKSFHVQNSLPQAQPIGRPVPVFYSNGMSNGTLEGSDVKTTAPQAAMLLSPPKQCDSPKIEGGKYQVSAHQIQQAVQSMKATNNQDVRGVNANQFAGLGHFHDVSGISSSVPSARPQVPHPSQASAAAAFKKDEMTMREMLQMQIAELNQQHAEAQQRIKLLYQEQQTIQPNDVQDLVSPPISPIPPASESEAASETNQASSTTNSNSSKILAGRGIRGITVSIPRVETVAMSPDSPPHQLPRRGMSDAVVPGGSQQASNQAYISGVRLAQQMNS